MDEALINRVAEAVCARLTEKPKALCIGTPTEDFPFKPVTQAPYEAVVLASLTPAQLLQMPDDTVCRALLTGLPVYLCQSGLEYRNYPEANGKALRAMLLSKERQLRTLGVQKLEHCTKKRLVTAQHVQQLMKHGRSLPSGAILTPLAQDIWEGKA